MRFAIGLCIWLAGLGGWLFWSDFKRLLVDYKRRRMLDGMVMGGTRFRRVQVVEPPCYRLDLVARYYLSPHRDKENIFIGRHVVTVRTLPVTANRFVARK